MVKLLLTLMIKTRASRAFGALRKSVFQKSSLSRQTKKIVYQVVVLGVLLYAAETWLAKQNIRRLKGFHDHCLRSILGINRVQQCVQHISNEEMRKRFDMQIPLSVKITSRGLQWLSHVAQMDDLSLPKHLLFGWFPNLHPAHGVKLRWRDKVKIGFLHDLELTSKT